MRAVVALVALSVGAFSFVTTEILPIGLLTLMADDLGRSRAEIGLVMTGYALVVVLMSLPMARVTRRVPRRLLLGATLAVAAAGTLATALADSYWTLLAARLVVAVTQALFWSVVASTATALFPPHRRGWTVARVSVGAALSPVLGVPAGTWLGQQLGWRAAFMVLAGLTLVTFTAVVTLLPSTVPSGADAAGATTPDRRRYAMLLAVTTVGVTGAMAAQTYVTPFLLDVGRFAAGSLGPLLLVSGAGGVAGTLFVGRFLDRHGWLSLMVPLAVLSVAFLVLFAAGAVQPVTVVTLAVQGAAFSTFAAAVQNRVLQVAPGSIDMAAAGGGTAFNVGIALGSSLGGLLLEASGVRIVVLAGAVLTAVALGLLLAEPAVAHRDKASREPVWNGSTM